MVIKLPRVVGDLVYEDGKPVLSLSLLDENGGCRPLIVDDRGSNGEWPLVAPNSGTGHADDASATAP
jgi:hypothetical protein